MRTLTKEISTSPPRHHGQPMSAGEFAALPDDGYRYEYLKGVATMMSPAGGLHGDIASRLTYLLGAYLYPQEIGRLFDSSTGFRLPNDDVRVPDIAVILQGRLSGEESPVGFIEIPPDLAVEVISPNERYEDIQQQIAQYLGWGVQAVWVVEPSTRTVTVHTVGSVARLAEGDTLEGGTAVPDFACLIEQIFP